VSPELPIAATFRSGTYTEKIATEDIILYRQWGGKASETGSYLTRKKPTGPMQNQMDSAILPEFGNTLENTAVIHIPKGTKYYEGVAGSQKGTVGFKPNLHGGGGQIYVPKVKKEWVVK